MLVSDSQPAMDAQDAQSHMLTLTSFTCAVLQASKGHSEATGADCLASTPLL